MEILKEMWEEKTHGILLSHLPEYYSRSLAGDLPVVDVR